MPVAKVYTKSVWDAFGRALDALPEKPDTERGVTVRDAMKDMRVRVRTAQAKDYTLEQIAEQAQRNGLDITAGTIRYALRSTGKGSGARPAPGARDWCREGVYGVDLHGILTHGSGLRANQHTVINLMVESFFVVTRRAASQG